MSKTIKQIADELGVSKQAIQKRLSREPLLSSVAPYISTIGGTKYIAVDGENLIKSAFGKNGMDSTSIDMSIDNSDTSIDKSIDKKTTSIPESIDKNESSIPESIDKSDLSIAVIETFNNAISALQKQLEIKDSQIENLYKQLEAKDLQIKDYSKKLDVQNQLHAGTTQALLREQDISNDVEARTNDAEEETEQPEKESEVETSNETESAIVEDQMDKKSPPLPPKRNWIQRAAIKLFRLE